MSDTAELATVFDADNHYWEASDAFTRYRSPEFAERGVVVREVDGRMWYMVHGDLHPWIPVLAMRTRGLQPGAFLDRSGPSITEMLTSEDPKQHPEWFNRDARLGGHGQQGVEDVFMFPSQGVCMEGPMQPDVEAILDIFRGFNRWIDDEWGFGTTTDLRRAVPDAVGPRRRDKELAWVLDRGARIVAVRPGPVFTPDGWKSPQTRRSTRSGRAPPRRDWWRAIPGSTTAIGRGERRGPFVELRESPPPGGGVVAELLRADRRRADGAPADPRLHGGDRRAGAVRADPRCAWRASRTV